jgi:sugar/nucleoside kinase (ribokinase family)
MLMNIIVCNDEFGTKLKAKLKRNGVNVSGVLTVEKERSGAWVVIVEAGGERRNIV